MLRHAETCQALGILVVPFWESAPFWPLLCLGKGRFALFVTDFRLLPLVAGLFIAGKSGSVLFDDEIPKSAVFAMRIDFSIGQA